MSIVCYIRLLFRSIYIAKTKVALSRLDLYNKIKTLFAVFLLPFHLFRHSKTDTGKYTFATYCSYPNVPLLFSCPSMNRLWLTHSLCIHWVSMLTTSLNSIKTLRSYVPFIYMFVYSITFYLLSYNDNRISRILGPCLCTLDYIRQNLAMYTSLQLA